MNKHEKYLYSLVACLFVLMVVFQNCEQQTTLSSSAPENNNVVISVDHQDEFINSVNSPVIQPIRATLVLDEAQIPQDYFAVYSTVKLSFSYFDFLDSSNLQDFNWDIKRIFPKGTLFQQKATSDQPEYIHTFSEIGVYDISVVPAGGDDDTFVEGHKTLVVGLCNENQNILEITLAQGTLQSNTSSVFDLSYFDEDETETPNVLWRVIHDNKEIAGLNSNQTQLAAHWDNISGEALVEVFAQLEGDDCIFHRQKWVNIDQAIRPHFNYIRPVDDDPKNVLLLNNDIYVYLRASQNRSIWIDIKNADKCLFNGQIVADCRGLIPSVNKIDSDMTKCHEEEFVVTAYRDDGKAVTVTEAFYNFCPASDEYCAFGPQKYRPDEHRCSPPSDETI